MNKKLEKYVPFILIAVTLVFGVFLLFKRGMISMPGFLNTSTSVDIKKPSVVEILFKEKEYTLSYADTDPSKYVNISRFDKIDQWQGDGSIEEGITDTYNVISLIDRSRKKAIAYLNKNLNLAPIDTIKFTINLKSDPEDLESVNLMFGNKDLTQFYRFPITNVSRGINYFAIPKYRFSLVEEAPGVIAGKNATSAASQSQTFGWDKVERVQLELLSRPEANSNLEVGWIQGEKDEVFIPDWNWDGEEHFFNLDQTSDGKTTLFVQYVGGSRATLRKVGSVKDFSYSAKITSIAKGNVSLFFRGDYKTGFGYYITTGGINNNEWVISKYSVVNKQPTTTVLMEGEIGNFAFRDDQPFWLKVTTKNNTISAYFSLDSNNYTKLGEVNDGQISGGGIGIAVSEGGAGYFDDFRLAQ